MEDWKGNKIEVGQTILTINVKSITEGSRLVAMFRDDNGVWHELDTKYPVEPKQYLWEIQRQAVITEQNSCMTISFGDAPSQISIDHIDSFCHAQPWQIIAIKWISDNEQEYYDWYFSNY